MMVSAANFSQRLAMPSQLMSPSYSARTQGSIPIAHIEMLHQSLPIS